MSIEAMSWALSAEVGDPGDRDAATRKLILIGRANHAHKNGRNSWAGNPVLAGYAGCDARTIQRQTKRLVADGWIRVGDQAQVAHIRGDRRPVVYDLAMTEAVQATWAAAHAAGDSSWESEQRGDAHWGRGDNLSPRPEGHGVTDGVTPNAPRGDTAMSPKPLGTIEPSGAQSVSPSPTPGRGQTGLTDIDIDIITMKLQGANPGRSIGKPFARQVATQILARAQATVANPLRYVLAGIDADPEEYRPTPGPPTKTACCPLPGHGSYPAHGCGACRSEQIAEAGR